MSKTGELKMLRYGRSIDAPINYHHRTGDSEGSGENMLDLYAQEESAEEVYFGSADERAREMFLKGFKVYLKKVYNEQEREFLKRLLLGKESPFKIGQSLGVEHFDFLQGIQLKAFKKAKPLVKLAIRTGWSGAETFTETIFTRLDQLRAGYSLNEILPQNKRVLRARAYYKAYYEQNSERLLAQGKAYRERNREKTLARYKAYHERNREKILARKKAYREQNREKILAREKAYREQNREKILAREKAYREQNREKILARGKAYREQNREKVAEQKRLYRERNRERLLAQGTEYRERNREKVAEQNRLYRERNREKILARKKAYREQNREKILARYKAYYEQNREKALKYRKAYYEQNREKISEERKKAYRGENREKLREQAREYYAKQKALKQAKNAAKTAENNLIVCLPYVQE